MKAEDLFTGIKDLPDHMGVKAVFGEPVTAEGRTVVPVASVMYGFGLGFGQGPEPVTDKEPPVEVEAGSGMGGGSGAAGATTPRAVVEITADQVRVVPIIDEGRIALAGIFTGIWSIFWIAMTIKAIFGKK
jgi:uncharacterized spore protein YtfJ